MTRCKPGEMAYFHTGVTENLAKFVQVLGPANPGLHRMILWHDRGPWWHVECKLPIVSPCGHTHGTRVGEKFHDFVPDAHLTPVRDAPGQDETLTWVPKRDLLKLPAPTKRKKKPETVT